MRLVHPYMLVGCAFALLVGLVALIGGLRRGAATRRFGDFERVRELFTSDPSQRRAWKAILLVVATALAFVAAARPQYGLGTRIVPATNLDIAICLDFSKSMYAMDLRPNRLFQARAEVAKLVKELHGASFAAIAFSGEPIGLPLTPDGAAVVHFFRSFEPVDMPVPGTAIGRALESARDLLRHAPNADKHRQVIVLVTDGEDLEGDPVSVAKSAAKDHIVIHVVQVGGRHPEAIPDVDEKGEVRGYRRDRDGKQMTTQLSPEAERDLAAIASETRGIHVRSEKGATGVDKVTDLLKEQMTVELNERVETVHEDIYYWFVLGAVLLLVIEAFVFSARARPRPRVGPPPELSPQVAAGLKQMLLVAPRPGQGQAPPGAPSPWVPGAPKRGDGGPSG